MNVQEIVKPFIRRLRVTGSRLTGLCPFHPDRNPSFSMSMEPGKEGLYYCFSCHASGNLRKFLNKMKLSQEVVERSLRELPVTLPRKRYKQGAKQYSILPESVLGAFHHCPTRLLDEGFTMQTLATYGIGFDSKLERITFPLRNIKGDLIGVSGRAVYGAEPRYLMYTEKEFPTHEDYARPRKDFLWNLDVVYQRYLAGFAKAIFVVEGFKVCMWLGQHHYKNVIAVLGSTMTRPQKLLLEDIPVRFIVALDNDDAGRSGVYSIGKMLLKIPGAEVYTLDPDILDRLEVQQLDELGADELQRVLGKPISFIEYAQKRKRRISTNEPRY